MATYPRLGISLCAGGGGLDMGIGLAEPVFATACYVEIEEYPRQCLAAAQAAGYIHPAPIWDDLKRFSGRPWRGIVDTVLAGYPCQPFSAAGKRGGVNDPRHLWPDVARVIEECGPEWVFLENVAGHVSLGLETVLRELWEMGWTPAAGIFSAGETGAPHERQRVFIVAHRAGERAGKQNSPQRAEPRQDTRQPSAGHGRGLHGEVAHRDRAGCGRGAEPDGPPEQPGQQAQGRRNAQRRNLELAHACGAGSQGQQRGQCNAGERQDAPGFAGPSGGTGVFPPGPSDSAAWAEVLRVAPDFAPAISLGDVKRLADHFAQMVARGELAEAQAQSRVCLASHGLAHRARALRLLGNGVSPIQAAYAWRTLAAAHGLQPIELGGDA